ncbi:MAG TPA: hypothetical protein VN641_18790 [Urbifossiella sp.]|nr:hypothetical protein [Urbifossiella sp.]
MSRQLARPLCRGIGASHQTGWTALVAKLLQARTPDHFGISASVVDAVAEAADSWRADARPAPTRVAGTPGSS